MDTKKLSAHLVSLQTTPSYTDATQHTFLELAGNGTLPLSRLALWLSQDRIYAAHAYPRFIGALISRIPFNSSDTISDPSEKLKEEILHVLVKCLDNIMLEVEFFKYTASQFGLDINEWAVRKGTRDYTAEMARVSTASSLEEGIIFLWAMEKVVTVITIILPSFILATSGLLRCLELCENSTAKKLDFAFHQPFCGSSRKIRSKLEYSRIRCFCRILGKIGR